MSVKARERQHAPSQPRMLTTTLLLIATAKEKVRNQSRRLECSAQVRGEDLVVGERGGLASCHTESVAGLRRMFVR